MSEGDTPHAQMMEPEGRIWIGKIPDSSTYYKSAWIINLHGLSSLCGCFLSELSHN